MAWRRPGDKPLSEPMVVRLPTHICVVRPQWVNISEFIKHSSRRSQVNELKYTRLSNKKCISVIISAVQCYLDRACNCKGGPCFSDGQEVFCEDPAKTTSMSSQEKNRSVAITRLPTDAITMTSNHVTPSVNPTGADVESKTNLMASFGTSEPSAIATTQVGINRQLLPSPSPTSALSTTLISANEAKSSRYEETATSAINSVQGTNVVDITSSAIPETPYSSSTATMVMSSMTFQPKDKSLSPQRSNETTPSQSPSSAVTTGDIMLQTDEVTSSTSIRMTSTVTDRDEEITTVAITTTPESKELDVMSSQDAEGMSFQPTNNPPPSRRPDEIFSLQPISNALMSGIPMLLSDAITMTSKHVSLSATTPSPHVESETSLVTSFDILQPTAIATTKIEPNSQPLSSKSPTYFLSTNLESTSATTSKPDVEPTTAEIPTSMASKVDVTSSSVQLETTTADGETTASRSMTFHSTGKSIPLTTPKETTSQPLSSAVTFTANILLADVSSPTTTQRVIHGTTMGSSDVPSKTDQFAKFGTLQPDVIPTTTVMAERIFPLSPASSDTVSTSLESTSPTTATPNVDAVTVVSSSITETRNAKLDAHSTPAIVTRKIEPNSLPLSSRSPTQFLSTKLESTSATTSRPSVEPTTAEITSSMVPDVDKNSALIQSETSTASGETIDSRSVAFHSTGNSTHLPTPIETTSSQPLSSAVTFTTNVLLTDVISPTTVQSVTHGTTMGSPDVPSKTDQLTTFGTLQPDEIPTTRVTAERTLLLSQTPSHTVSTSLESTRLITAGPDVDRVTVVNTVVAQSKVTGVTSSAITETRSAELDVHSTHKAVLSSGTLTTSTTPSTFPHKTLSSTISMMTTRKINGISSTSETGLEEVAGRSTLQPGNASTIPPDLQSIAPSEEVTERSETTSTLESATDGITTGYIPLKTYSSTINITTAKEERQIIDNFDTSKDEISGRTTIKPRFSSVIFNLQSTAPAEMTEPLSTTSQATLNTGSTVPDRTSSSVSSEVTFIERSENSNTFIPTSDEITADTTSHEISSSTISSINEREGREITDTAGRDTEDLVGRTTLQPTRHHIALQSIHSDALTITMQKTTESAQDHEAALTWQAALTGDVDLKTTFSHMITHPMVLTLQPKSSTTISGVKNNDNEKGVYGPNHRFIIYPYL